MAKKTRQLSADPQLFEVLLPIEGLSCPEPLAVGDVLFECMAELTEPAADLHQIEQVFRRDFQGKTAARLRVGGDSDDLAVATAQEMTDTALNELRVALAINARRGIHARQYLQRREGSYLIRALGAPEGTGVALGWRVGASPIELGIGGDFRRDVEDALAELAPLRGDEIRSKLGVRLRRAAQWLGSSLTRTSPDDAILDLSTALECFLASKSDKRKGEAIAVRSVLLLHLIEGRFPNPLETLGQYELRSNITHGEARLARPTTTSARCAGYASLRCAQLSRWPHSRPVRQPLANCLCDSKPSRCSIACEGG